MSDRNNEQYNPSDKFCWKEGDLAIDKLVWRGKVVKQNSIRPKKEEPDDHPKHSGFDCPVYGELIPKGTILKRNNNGRLSQLSPEDYEKEPKTPVQAFVSNIAFPKSLDEVLQFAERGNYNVEDILMNEDEEWTVPNWAKIGDIVFFMHSKTAIQTIRKLCTALNMTDDYDEEDREILEEWLDRGRDLYNQYGGKIYAYGRVSGNPGGLNDDDEDILEIVHWKSRIYATIERVHVLDNPIDISEFNSFLLISRCGSITPVYGTEFEKLKALILKKNDVTEDYLVDAMAAPVPLAKMDETNWLSVANEYRRSFLLEQQFRNFYVDRFLSVLGDRKTIYRECRCRKAGMPDSFVDNIILFNGKYLPVEVKLNVDNEIDLPGQVKKYCNNDIRFRDTGAESIINNQKSYMKNVLIIDTVNVYLYDDRTGQINSVASLDDIREIGDISLLRGKLIAAL